MAGTTNAIVAKFDEVETLEMGPIKIRVMEDGRNTDNRIGAVLLTIAPKTSGPTMHWHRMHDETFLITKGRFRFHTDKGSHEARVGDLVVVPPKAIHTFENPYDEEAEFFNTFTPAYYVDYLRMMVQEARKAAEQGGKLSPEKMQWVMAQFATFPPEVQGEVGGEGQE